ncbi:Slo-interacting protein 1 [Aphelenchoides besseyi]|nr:Slo-interacting protein 1 [Aphelenchoides besseyi]KAI6200585.1 Slo-interacting protein 1 [Aphelenchoides besseyi]
MTSRLSSEVIERLHALLCDYVQLMQLNGQMDENVIYREVESTDIPDDQRHEFMTSIGVSQPSDELRTASTQTDPVSDIEEDDGLLLEEEDIYEEIPASAGNMERLLLLNEPIDYEEVELRRSASCQRLGLTLCYGGLDEKDTDIFVSQQGAEDEEEHVVVEEGTSTAVGKLSLGPLAENDDSTENSAAHEHEKDSGLSRTTDSDSEHPVAVLTPVAEADDRRLPTKSRASMERTFERELAHLHNEMENIRLECARLMNRRESANSQQQRSAAEQAEQASSLMQMIERLSQNTKNSIDQTTKLTRETETQPQMTAVQPKSMNLYFNSTPLTPKSVRRNAYDETTSSAYNTGGDSCRSTPNKNELLGHVPPPRPIHLTVAQKKLNVGPLSPASEHAYHTIETPVASQPANQFRLPRFAIQPPLPSQPVPEARDFRRPRLQPSATNVEPATNAYRFMTMYTTPDRLTETIEFQQRLLRQAFGGDSAFHTLRPTTSNLPPSTIAPSDQLTDYHTVQDNRQQSGNFEWKVKRRADGSRYVTRRPLRAQVLKAREEQLNRERTGLSTDDDAGSELKTGKFWTRQQRKQHLERQRERKQKRNELLNAKQAAGAPERLIHELSHRKQMRRNGHQFFDKYTTLQEMLIHGARDPTLRPHGAFLLDIQLVTAITCYQCSNSEPSCQTTCSNALACALQIPLPSYAIIQPNARCDHNITVQGCLADIITQTLTCYCTTDFCNRSLNSTLTRASGTAAPTQIMSFSTPAGRKRREVAPITTPRVPLVKAPKAEQLATDPNPPIQPPNKRVN